MPTELTNMEYDEVSLVGAGANQDSDVVLSKRREDAEEVVHVDANYSITKAKAILAKHNPNHDPKDGRFTSGPGGSGGGRYSRGAGHKYSIAGQIGLPNTKARGKVGSSGPTVKVVSIGKPVRTIVGNNGVLFVNQPGHRYHGRKIHETRGSNRISALKSAKAQELAEFNAINGG